MRILKKRLNEFDHGQVTNLVLLGYSELKAMQAYLLCHKDTVKAADLLHFNTFVTNRFTDHMWSVMRANQARALKIFAIAKKLNILRNFEDEDDFAYLVAELIVRDHAAVNGRTSRDMDFEDALKDYLKELVSQPDKKHVLDVAQAFHDALRKSDVKRFRVTWYDETSF